MDVNGIKAGVQAAAGKVKEAANIKKGGTTPINLFDSKIKGKLGGKIGDAVEFAKDKGVKIKDKIKDKSLIAKIKDGVQNVASKLKTAASGKKGKLALIAVAGGAAGLVLKGIHDKVTASKDGSDDEETNSIANSKSKLLKAAAFAAAPAVVLGKSIHDKLSGKGKEVQADEYEVVDDYVSDSAEA